MTIEQALKVEYNKGYADGSLSVTSEIRNKAIDDFADKLLSQPMVDKSVVRRIKEQLKAGGTE